MTVTGLSVTYYASPVGTLEIKSSIEAIHAILFVNAWKGPKLDVSEMTGYTGSDIVRMGFPFRI